VKLNETLTQINCLNCRNVVDPVSEDSALRCPSCNYTYPVFDSRIPLLLKDHKPNLAAAWLEYRKYIADSSDRLEEVKDALGRQPERSTLLNRAIAAYEHDNTYLSGLRDRIEQALPRKDIDELEDEGRLPKQYTLAEGLGFFHRDWCGSERAENEIRTIVGTVAQQIEAFAEDADAVLVPGAGAGRFACELAATYDNTYAFDFSLHMAQIFYDIISADMELHRVNFRSNVVKTEDVVPQYHLSLDAPGDDRLRSNLAKGGLAYYVGNALDIPFPGDSLSAVACLYFIDIVPIKEHMNEIRRTLKRGGLFINFGPLRYMRGDVANMLSGEEIMDLYRHSGFDILAHDVVPNTQLASSPVITSVQSNNFMFVARKR
jgi:SAM-dependent methyltransferase